jgi:hypothetical protein
VQESTLASAAQFRCVDYRLDGESFMIYVHNYLKYIENSCDKMNMVTDANMSSRISDSLPF